MPFEKQSSNQRGGARSGAGRKKGEHNKRTDEALEQAKATGITPLEYLLTVMRDGGNEQKERMSAAVAAAPYLHAKLSSVEVGGRGENGEHLISVIERVIVNVKD